MWHEKNESNLAYVIYLSYLLFNDEMKKIENFMFVRNWNEKEKKTLKKAWNKSMIKWTFGVN
jgi:hypothetical protein